MVADRLKEVNEIHAKALASADAERQKLETRLEVLNQTKKKLNDKLKAVEEEREEALKAAKEEGQKESAAKVKELQEDLKASQHDAQILINQLEDIKKQMAMADEAAISFKAAFGQWQRAHADMDAALERAAPETAQKLLAAMDAQMDAWRR